MARAAWEGVAEGGPVPRGYPMRRRAGRQTPAAAAGFMHVAHFVHRYPPALGGAEAYFARLGRYLAGRGDAVTVWTTTAVDLEAMWTRAEVVALEPSRRARSEGTRLHRPCSRPTLPLHVRRYPPSRSPPAGTCSRRCRSSPSAPGSALTLPCNPVCPAHVARTAARYDGPLDAVHATAFPYAFPILCGLRLARRRGVPFLLTPFLHLGDPADPRRPHAAAVHVGPAALAAAAGRPRVRADAAASAGAAIGLRRRRARVVLQGLGVDPAECTGGDRDAARRRGASAPGEVVVGHLANNSVEKGTRRSAAGGRTRVGRGAALPRRAGRAGDAELPRASGTASARKERVARLGVLTDAGEARLLRRASTCSPCRRGPTRSAWCCWRRGRTARRTSSTGPAARRSWSATASTVCTPAAATSRTWQRQLSRLVADDELAPAAGRERAVAGRHRVPLGRQAGAGQGGD